MPLSTQIPMQRPKQTNQGSYPTVKHSAVTMMRDVVDALEQNPLDVRSHLSTLAELSKRSNIEELNILLADLQRSLREQALYGSSGYDQSVKCYVHKLTALFNAVLADASGEVH